MSELVTMRVTLDPVLKEQLKLRAIERGMTHAELLPKLLAQGLQAEPDKADTATNVEASMSSLVPTEPASEIGDAPPPEPSVQETITQLFAEHEARLSKVLVLIAEDGERIEQLCNQHQGQIEKAVQTIGKHAEQAIENSNTEWRGVMHVRRQNRYWLGGTAAATLVVTWIVLALISGTSLGRKIAVWQAGAESEWQAAQSLASHGSYLHGELMAETKAFLDNPEFRSPYAKCIDRAKAAKSAVRCSLVFPALSAKP
jgi:hypothetical protein